MCGCQVLRNTVSCPCNKCVDHQRTSIIHVINKLQYVVNPGVILQYTDYKDNLISSNLTLLNLTYPNITYPKQEVLQAIQTSGALHYLPQLWSDMVLFDHCSRDKLVGLMLTTLTHHQPSPDDLMLTERLVTIAKDIWCRVQAQDPTRRNKVCFRVYGMCGKVKAGSHINIRLKLQVGRVCD
ncbi:Protein PTCD3, mitochondrial [Portunus trituberculatus]|uniref:Protein PTCD3, mitochondrial n=1 Tax=Portunus trituberculatus TaxID=210409 RepID=A0A5B7IDG8_PORTR|nr:Protein PTCD3, mitochondrial [Portunus trituberculatus]